MFHASCDFNLFPIETLTLWIVFSTGNCAKFRRGRKRKLASDEEEDDEAEEKEEDIEEMEETAMQRIYADKDK